MGLHLYLGDITKMETDAIVNAANTDLKRAPGICEAIFAASDGKALAQACRKFGRCPVGYAVVTPSCGLPCKYIIHVAGPGWYGGVHREKDLLERCYLHALQKALVYGCRSVAFPLIFSGECHIPRPISIQVAAEAILDFLQFHELEVYLVLYKPGIYEMAKDILKLNGIETLDA